MATQYQMASQFPPVTLLANAADGGGRTSAYADLASALKAWIIVKINQGAANTVLLSPMQATSSGGAGSKAISAAVPIWLDDATATSDALVAQTAATTFTTDANVADKLVLFEINPETCLDMANGFNHIAISTGASNAANITSALLIAWNRIQAASPPTTVA
jgi:hypothetical protein